MSDVRHLTGYQSKLQLKIKESIKYLFIFFSQKSGCFAVSEYFKVSGNLTIEHSFGWPEIQTKLLIRNVAN